MEQQKRPSKSIKSYFPVKKPKAESPLTPALALSSTTIDTSTTTSALPVINSSAQSATSPTILPTSTPSDTSSSATSSTTTLPISTQSATLPTSAQSATSSAATSSTATSAQSVTSPATLPTSTPSATSPTDISRSINEPPSQPILSSYVQNSDKRSFQSQWFKDRPWLEYSVIQNKAYCYYCRHYGILKLAAKSQCNAFVSGFCNWKKALGLNSGLKQHASSESHLQATTNYQEYLLRFNTKTSVIAVLDTGRSQQIKRNRDRIAKIASAILLCARQMIALRSHYENETSNNRGNLLEILSWSSETDPIIKSIMESSNNATYLSHQIQNELLEIMANQIRRKIAEQISVNFYSLMADESKDISGNAQLSIVIRVVSSPADVLSNKNKKIQEYFLGFIRLQQFDAVTLSNEIVQFLNLHKIDLKKCIAMCFDGASVMSGCHAGVQTILRDNFMPKGIYIHCFAHKLNLVIIDVCQVVTYCAEFYSIISKITTYFTASGVTNVYFKNAQQLLELDETTKLKKWSNIRWDSRWSSIDSIIKNYRAILKALSDLINDGDSRSADANGLLIALKEPLFIVTLFVIHKILRPIKILSNQLQDESLDFETARELISSIVAQMKSYRDDSTFESLYSKVAQFCTENQIDISQKSRQRRQKQVPARFNDCIATLITGHREYADNEEQYRTTIYYPLIDSVLIELNHRFSNANMEILISISSLCPKNEKFLDFEILKPFASHLDINPDMLKNELNVLRPMLKNKKLLDLKELYCELIPFVPAFPNVVLMVQGAMTIPVTSATCERSFSKMKTIKTALRNTMSDERLSNLCVLSIERDFKIDFDSVVEDFSSNHKNRRIMLK
ncbi:unnamed protein product [Rotaria magnacalcarata]|uniref:TTF-type domain-containing protein n=1 Tax=Rotaria magnacalcarata TaxID=392030 RepID=A0A816EV64_9BILA|nr:unnamed protein product [Rotaria magnacalcarata]